MKDVRHIKLDLHETKLLKKNMKHVLYDPDSEQWTVQYHINKMLADSYFDKHIWSYDYWLYFAGSIGIVTL